MRTTVVVVLAIFVTSTAFAGTITSMDPQSIVVNSGEQFLTLRGRDLGGFVSFSGPASSNWKEAAAEVR